MHKNDPAEFVNEFVGHQAIQRSKGRGTGQHATTGYTLGPIYHVRSFQVTDMHAVAGSVLYNTHTTLDEGDGGPRLRLPAVRSGRTCWKKMSSADFAA